MRQLSKFSYVVVTPVRDEAPHIRHTIESLAKQTVLPRRWIIVDDGSSDGTGDIADEAALKYSWITVLHRRNRGFRKTGGGVIEAFYDGYALLSDPSTTDSQLSTDSWDFIVKLDADLSFDADYFEKCFSRFESDPKLGVGAGLVWEYKRGELVVGSPGDPSFHVRGAAKTYRRECWRQIGGLIQDLGWDTVDELKANMLGWRTATLKDLKLVHHKLTGSADGSWSRCLKLGRCNYITGYHPLFMVCKCVKRLLHRPYVLASLGIGIGFLSGYLKRVPQVNDETLIRWTRDQQLRRLSFRTSLWT